MVSHIVLVNFTPKGIENIKDSPKRATAFVEAAGRSGVEVEGLFWTAGHHDGVLLLNAPDDQTAAGVTLALGRGGYVQTQTLRAFDREAMETILGKI
jgi:uncharacterized protein with GYD domain